MGVSRVSRTASKTAPPRLVIAAPRSGEGKTTVALGLMAAFRRRGLRVQGFKIGPDYLDTGYQRYAAGAPGRNLDLFLMGEPGVRRAVAETDADIAVIEGVMGLFDGHRDGVTPTSTAAVAKRISAPVVLVIDAASMADSVGALALGFKTYDPEVELAGVILNRWGERRSRTAERMALEKAGVEILGYLPPADGLALPSRHLGLVVADELGAEAAAAMERLGAQLEAHADLERLLAIARRAPSEVGAEGNAAGALSPGTSAAAEHEAPAPPSAGPRIAVAWDDAFAFYYADNLELLRRHGAELVFFSPLTAAEPPVCDGLYFGGGYPELRAAELSANVSFREGLAAALAAGLPAYAECGGLLYLCESLVDLEGRLWPMVGAVPGRATMHERLQALDYHEAVLAADALLGDAGAVVRGHEFHFSSCALDNAGRPAYLVEGLPEGYAAGDLFASYVHLHFAGNSAALEHWLTRCRAYAAARDRRGAAAQARAARPATAHPAARSAGNHGAGHSAVNQSGAGRPGAGGWSRARCDGRSGRSCSSRTGV
jgi:cobyrinic acid a,c-diamide synthase